MEARQTKLELALQQELLQNVSRPPRGTTAP